MKKFLERFYMGLILVFMYLPIVIAYLLLIINNCLTPRMNSFGIIADTSCIYVVFFRQIM